MKSMDSIMERKKSMKFKIGLFFIPAFMLCSCGASGDSNPSTGEGSFPSQGSLGEPSLPHSEPISTQPEVLEPYYDYPQLEVLPRIDITTADGSNDFATKYNQSHKLNGEISYVDCTYSLSNCPEEFAFEGVEGEVKVRGNYTLNYPKKPLRIKFSKKRSMLGMNEGEKFKSWVLLADYKDSSMLRNETAFYLGNNLLGKDGLYASDYRNVEVYLNDTYWGMYLLCEQQEAKGGRVEVMTPEDGYTGTDIGYLFEYDGYYTDEKDDPTFTIDYDGWKSLQKYSGEWTNPGVYGYTIKSDIFDPSQVTYISNRLNQVFKVCYEAVYNHKYYAIDESEQIVETLDMTEISAISEVVDIDSFVDMYLLQEISCDADISWSSFYLSLDASSTGDKKLRVEAPWDYDSAFGGKCVENGEGLYAAESQNPWLLLFVRCPWFMELVQEKWEELKKHHVLESSLEQIDFVSDIYMSQFQQNFVRWPESIGNTHSELYPIFQTFTTQKEAADYFKNWLIKRYSFINRFLQSETDIYGKPIEVGQRVPSEDQTPYLFEMEDERAFLSSDILRRSGNGASGDGYLGNVSGGVGKSMEYSISSSQEGSAFLSMGLSAQNYDADVSLWFSISINGQPLSLPPCPVTSAGADFSWHNWVEVHLMEIDLIEGVNVIRFETISSSTTNVDYFKIYSTFEVGW